ncbi:MAG: LPS export ABC transporter permease LptF [Arenicellales bacterium]
MIINRAMVTEVLRTSGAVTVVIISIFMVMRVLGFLQQAAQGDIPVHSILILLLLKVVAYADVILPLMLYIAILMVVGRWCRDNEMAVLSACGVSLFNFLKPLAVLVLVMGAVVAAFSFYLTPKANMAGWKIEMDFRRHDKLSEVVPGIFMETRQGHGVYFVESYDKDTGRYQNVFVYKSSFGKEGVVVSKYAYERTDALTGDRFLVLTNGTRYEGQPGKPDYRIVDFETYALRIQPAVSTPVRGPVKGRSTLVIAGDPNPILVSEMQWRISKVLVIPILGLFALTFSFAPPRQSRLPGMIMAFLFYFVYTNFLGFGVAMISKGKLNPHIGLWGIHAVFLVIALVLFYRRARNLPLVPLPRARLPRLRLRWS